MNRNALRCFALVYGVFLFGCTVHSTAPTTTTTMTKTVTTSIPAASIGSPPAIGYDSKRPQIRRFVAYFTAKGFPASDLGEEYFPSGHVKKFHYHAAYQRSAVTADIDPTAHVNSLSILQGGDVSGSTHTYHWSKTY